MTMKTVGRYLWNISPDVEEIYKNTAKLHPASFLVAKVSCCIDTHFLVFNLILNLFRNSKIRADTSFSAFSNTQGNLSRLSDSTKQLTKLQWGRSEFSKQNLKVSKGHSHQPILLTPNRHANHRQLAQSPLAPLDFFWLSSFQHQERDTK